jgi:hypothetical protein
MEAYGDTYRRPGRRLLGHLGLHGVKSLLQPAVPLGEVIHSCVPGQGLLAPGRFQHRSMGVGAALDRSRDHELWVCLRVSVHRAKGDKVTSPFITMGFG